MAQIHFSKPKNLKFVYRGFSVMMHSHWRWNRKREADKIEFIIKCA